MKTLRILIIGLALSLALPAFAQETDATEAPDTVEATEAPTEDVTEPATEDVTEDTDNGTDAATEEPVAPVEPPKTPEPSADPPSPTPAEPKNIGEAVQAIPEIVKAFQSGDYLLGASLIIMLLVFAIRLFWKSLPKAAAPWVSIGIGVVSGMASAWASGSSWWQGLLMGLAAGLGAIGAWEAGGKKALKPKPAASE